MKTLAAFVNEDGAAHLMKRSRPIPIAPIDIPSLAKRLHSFISPDKGDFIHKKALAEASAFFVERATRFELATSTLARWRSAK